MESLFLGRPPWSLQGEGTVSAPWDCAPGACGCFEEARSSARAFWKKHSQEVRRNLCPCQGRLSFKSILSSFPRTPVSHCSFCTSDHSREGRSVRSIRRSCRGVGSSKLPGYNRGTRERMGFTFWSLVIRFLGHIQQIVTWGWKWGALLELAAVLLPVTADIWKVKASLNFSVLLVDGAVID